MYNLKRKYYKNGSKSLRILLSSKRKSCVDSIETKARSKKT